MKKSLLFIILTISTLIANAQPVSLSIASHHHERFWVFVNNIPLNPNAVESISIINLTADNYYLKIVLDNPQQSELSTSLRIKPNGSNYFLQFYADENRISLEFVNHPLQTAFTVPFKPQSGMPDNQWNGQRPNPNENHHHNGQQGNHQQGHNPPPAHEPDYSPQPCTEASFLNALKMIDNEKFEDSKLNMAKQVASSELLTTNQLIRIAKKFSFDDTKLNFLKYAYDYCFDKNKYYLVNEVFTFSTTKDELNKYIESRK